MLSNLIAQYSTEHYMPPIYNGASSSSDDPDEIRVELSTMVTSSFNVSVRRYDGSVYMNYSISKTNPVSFSLNLGWQYANLYADAHGTSDSNKGIYFKFAKGIYFLLKQIKLDE